MTADPVRVAVAGSTGSIGTQTLEVVAAAPEAFRVTALGASSSVELLAAQAVAHRPDVVGLVDDTRAAELAARLPVGMELVTGRDALVSICEGADVVVNGVVGFAGLPVTLTTLERGARLALANKESLIAAGPVVQRARRTPGAQLIPVDSEHGAIHQCLQGAVPGRVARIVITASGGPFRGRERAELDSVTVEDALAHPTWQMGPKITVDSSTLMNKGLEVIEAHELFGAPAGDVGVGLSFDEIEVVIHPQSIVHSMVEFRDGSTIAQLSQPDMRLPIGYALAYPDRSTACFGALDWSTAQRLDFEPPDVEAFPCLALAYAAGRLGGTGPAWLNAANEVAVEGFLAGRIRWVDLPDVLSRVLDRHDGALAGSVEEVIEADRRARELASAEVAAAAS